MPDKKKYPRQEVALFRYRLVAELAELPDRSPELAALLRQRAAARYRIPCSRRRSVTVGTLRRWRRLCQEGGLRALYPKRRNDKGRPRALSDAAAELLTGIKEGNRRLTVKAVIRQARDSGQLPEGTRLAPSTVHRLLKGAGLMERPKAGDGRDRRRFCYQFAGELAMSDVLHGPKILADGRDRRRKAKTYLICLLDDATRVVMEAAFAFSESVDAFLPVMRQALLKRGCPRRLYVEYVAGHIFHVMGPVRLCSELTQSPGNSSAFGRFAAHNPHKDSSHFSSSRSSFHLVRGPAVPARDAGASQASRASRFILKEISA